MRCTSCERMTSDSSVTSSPAPVEHGRRRLVARRLDAEDARHGVTVAAGAGVAGTVARTHLHLRRRDAHAECPSCRGRRRAAACRRTAIVSGTGWTPRSRRTSRRGPVTRTVSGSKRSRAVAGAAAGELHADPSAVRTDTRCATPSSRSAASRCAAARPARARRRTAPAGTRTSDGVRSSTSVSGTSPLDAAADRRAAWRRASRGRRRVRRRAPAAAARSPSSTSELSSTGVTRHGHELSVRLARADDEPEQHREQRARSP